MALDNAEHSPGTAQHCPKRQPSKKKITPTPGAGSNDLKFEPIGLSLPDRVESGPMEQAGQANRGGTMHTRSQKGKEELVAMEMGKPCRSRWLDSVEIMVRVWLAERLSLGQRAIIVAKDFTTWMVEEAWDTADLNNVAKDICQEAMEKGARWVTYGDPARRKGRKAEDSAGISDWVRGRSQCNASRHCKAGEQ